MNTNFLLFFFHTSRYFLQIIFRAFFRFFLNFHCHALPWTWRSANYPHVCVSLIIDTKFIRVEVDVAPSPDVYRYFLARWLETLGTRKSIAVLGAWPRLGGVEQTQTSNKSKLQSKSNFKPTQKFLSFRLLQVGS